MRRVLSVAIAALVAASCSSAATPSPGGSAAAPPSTGAGGASPSAGGGAAYDPKSISGTVVLSGWQASPDEGNALTRTLLAFQAAYPNIKVDYRPISGDYRVVMLTKFSSKEEPDLFYVNAEYAAEWIDQGFLEPLDAYVTKSAFDTSKFFPGYASVFKSADGKTFGFPKDGSTIGMAVNSDIVTSAPATLADLLTTADGLKGKDGLKAPLCLNAGLDRGLAFLYAQGGSLVSADGKTATIDSDASKAAVQWYLDLFKNGLGKTASDLGSGWCGEALGKKQAAMIFEGSWLIPYMGSTFPDVKYGWAPVPTGSSGSPVTISYTVSYSIGVDSKVKDAAFVLLSYLTGPDGMKTWTEGGVAQPSRSDVGVPKGMDVLASESAYSKPGSGFVKGYVDIQKAFGDALTAQIQGKTYDAGPVVEATKAAIAKALNG